MRALLFVALFTVISSIAWAGCENSTLVIRSNSGNPIKVYIDGETGTNPATPVVTVTELPAGRYQVKVVAVTTDAYGQTQRHTIFNGNIEVHSSVYLDAHVEDHKGMRVHENKEACGDKPVELENESNDMGNGNAPNTAPATGNSDNSSNPGYSAPPVQSTVPPASSTGNLPAHISDDDLYRIKTAISATQYEIKKLDTLKLLVKDYKFATSQVGDLMNLFSFESDKLTIAKLLYYQTVDRQNYSRLTGYFNFDARKEDFKKFMAGK